jgi:hypothetical protein
VELAEEVPALVVLPLLEEPLLLQAVTVSTATLHSDPTIASLRAKRFRSTMSASLVSVPSRASRLGLNVVATAEDQPNGDVGLG